MPLYIAAAGILVSILGTFMVSVKEGGDPQKALNIGEFGSAVFMVGFTYVLINNTLPGSFYQSGIEYTSMGVFYATLIGLFAGLGIGGCLLMVQILSLGKIKQICECPKNSLTNCKCTQVFEFDPE